MAAYKGSPNGGIYHAGSTRGGTESTEHKCGTCWGPYGRSAIPCPNDPPPAPSREVIAARLEALRARVRAARLNTTKEDPR